jgi:hypothetical protein
MHAADSHDRGKPEQAKAKANALQAREEDRVFERPSGDGVLCVTAALGNQRQGVV